MLPRSSLQDLSENPYHVNWWERLRNTYLRYTGREPRVESPQRRGLQELREARVAFDVRTDGLVVITAEASKPQASVDIVNAYVEALMARTRSFNVDDARVTREFLEQQLADVKKALAASEQAVRQFTAANGGLKIPERNQATVAQLSQAETSLAEIEASRKMLEVRVEALRQKAETQKREAAAVQPSAAVPSEARVSSAELQRLRSQLVTLEGTLLELRNRYTDQHPRVRVVKDRIAEIQHQLGDAIKESGPIVPAAGAVPPAERVNFAEQLIALEASFHSVSAQEEAMRNQVTGLRQNLKGLSNSELAYTRLNREADSNRALHAVLGDKLTAARIREQGEMKVVKVIDPPSYPVPAMNQRRLKFMLAGFVLALVAGAGVPATVEWLRRRVETADDIEFATGLPVLAMIPRVRSGRPVFAGDSPTARPGLNEQFIFTESFRRLRVSILLAMRAEGVRTVLVTSAFAHEGKSLVVMNLGLALAEGGTRVVIADSDLERPMLHRAMRVSENGGGLVKVLHSEQSVEQALLQVDDNLWLVPGGNDVHSHTRGMLASGRMRDVLQEIAGQADLVIADSSPVLLVPENLFLAGSVDAVIIVAQAGSTPCRDLTRAKGLLESSGAKLLGVVINDMPRSALHRDYKRYYDSYIKNVET
jgi:capsular exopolysaccharide synthesis family protein